MSDRMSDAAALGRQETSVNDAAARLARALRVAVEGHRGMVISNLELETMVNMVLEREDVPFRIRVWSR